MARSGNWAALARSLERDAARRRRELLAQAKQQAKMQESQRAAYEVSVFENERDYLVSMHKDCGPQWTWQEIARQAPPQQPTPRSDNETVALREQANYKPSFFERLFGGEKKRRADLETAVEEARTLDGLANDAAIADYRSSLELHAWEQKVAGGVLDGSLDAYRAVVEHLSPFATLAESGLRVAVEITGSDVIVVQCIVASEDIIPRDEKKLTNAGKLTVKAMAAGTYWSLYQDFVCGCAIRAAREVFALLPVSRVVVNVDRQGLNTATGHVERTTLLAANFHRDAVERLHFEKIDASDCMTNFPHRMKFKKTSGFDVVEPMSANESFISTGPRR